MLDWESDELEKKVVSKGQSSTRAKGLPLITIGISCFNAEKTIRRAILSAVRQDWPNKDIIIVDDASNDTSVDIIDNLCHQFPKIRLVRHTRNKGYSGALNTIIEQAKGEFVAIFDDDDESTPQRLRAQWSRITRYELLQHCPLILCYANRSVVKVGQTSPDHVAQAIGRRPPEPHGVAVADYLFGYACDRTFVWGMFGSCTLMARRETLLAIGAFDESFRRCAEWDFAIRAAFDGAHFIAVDVPLITQFKTAGHEKEGSIPLEYALRIRDKYKSYLKQRGLYWASRSLARYNFHAKNGKFWRSRVHAFMAYLISPALVRERLLRRVRLPS